MTATLKHPTTENKIWTDIIAVLSVFMAAEGLTGWNIRQNEQPTMQGFKNNSVYLSRVASRRHGWQGKRDDWDAENAVMIHTETYMQEIMFQATAFHKRSQTDATELTGGDVLNKIITFLMSTDGLLKMRAKNLTLLRISELREPAIVSDSAIFEKLPSFDFTVIIEQTEQTAIGKADIATLNIKRV